MRCLIPLFVIFLSATQTFPWPGQLAQFDHETGGISYQDIEVPDYLARDGLGKGDLGKDSITLLPGWPQKIRSSTMFPPSRGLAIADIDNDGKLDIIASSDADVFVFRSNGTLLWSAYVYSIAQSAPAVADVNNDGNMEIVQVARGPTRDAYLNLLDYRGDRLPGWPIQINENNLSSSPCLADFDGDSIMEIVIGENDWPDGYLHIIKLDGTEINNNFPVELDYGSAVTAAVGDVDFDGQKDIVYCSSRSLYVFGLDGKAKPGFPVTLQDSSTYSNQSPLLVDIDGDNTLEIITVTWGKAQYEDYASACVYNYKGEILNGWPHILYPNYTAATPPTAVDPSGGGNYKIYAGGWGKLAECPILFGFNEDASLLPNFPIEFEAGLGGFISVADIDNDNEYEVLFDCCLKVLDTTNNDSIYRGFLQAYNQDGTGPVDGFPLRPIGSTYMNGANICDINDNGVMDLFFLTYQDSFAYIYGYCLNVPYTPEKVLFDTYHANNRRDGLYKSPIPVSIKPNSHKQKNIPIIFFNTFTSKGCYVIQLELLRDNNLTIDVFNSIGQKVSKLFSGKLLKGKHRFEIKLGSLSAGIYFVKVFSRKSRFDFVERVVVFEK